MTGSPQARPAFRKKAAQLGKVCELVVVPGNHQTMVAPAVKTAIERFGKDAGLSIKESRQRGAGKDAGTSFLLEASMPVNSARAWITRNGGEKVEPRPMVNTRASEKATGDSSP